MGFPASVLSCDNGILTQLMFCSWDNSYSAIISQQHGKNEIIWMQHFWKPTSVRLSLVLWLSGFLFITNTVDILKGKKTKRIHTPTSACAVIYNLLAYRHPALVSSRSSASTPTWNHSSLLSVCICSLKVKQPEGSSVSLTVLCICLQSWNCGLSNFYKRQSGYSQQIKTQSIFL